MESEFSSGISSHAHARLARAHLSPRTKPIPRRRSSLRNHQGYANSWEGSSSCCEALVGLKERSLSFRSIPDLFPRLFTFSIANEQERNRTTASSNVNDRALHEVYLAPFLRSIQADVASGEFGIQELDLQSLSSRLLSSLFRSHVLVQPNQRIVGLPK